jgi:hypothetical protein
LRVGSRRIEGERFQQGPIALRVDLVDATEAIRLAMRARDVMAGEDFDEAFPVFSDVILSRTIRREARCRLTAISFFRRLRSSEAWSESVAQMKHSFPWIESYARHAKSADRTRSRLFEFFLPLPHSAKL